MAEILRPEVVWIEGRCYRINDPNTEVTAFEEHDLYENGICPYVTGITCIATYKRFTEIYLYY